MHSLYKRNPILHFSLNTKAMLAAALSFSPAQSIAGGAGRRRLISSGRISAAVHAAAPTSSPSPYVILGLPSGASACEIKAAYRRLARQFHPDAASAAGREGASADEFMRIHSAYSTLSDPNKRADYDQSVFVGAGWRRRPAAASSGYGRRTWETDQCW